jgi:hypothetical protein
MVTDKWISVKDKLPEEGELVLFFGLEMYPTVGYRDGKYYLDTADRYIGLITHWVHIPAPNTDG